MDRWRRWRPRRSAVGARRAGVRALGVLVVTAALAVLLAVWSHLARPPAAVAILGTMPALYLALGCAARRHQPARPRHRGQAGAWPPCGAVGPGGTGRASRHRRRPDAGIHGATVRNVSPAPNRALARKLDRRQPWVRPSGVAGPADTPDEFTGHPLKPRWPCLVITSGLPASGNKPRVSPQRRRSCSQTSTRGRPPPAFSGRGN